MSTRGQHSFDGWPMLHGQPQTCGGQGGNPHSYMMVTVPRVHSYSSSSSSSSFFFHAHRTHQREREYVFTLRPRGKRKVREEEKFTLKKNKNRHTPDEPCVSNGDGRTGRSRPSGLLTVWSSTGKEVGFSGGETKKRRTQHTAGICFFLLFVVLDNIRHIDVVRE